MYEAIEISMKMAKKFKDGIQGQYTTKITNGGVTGDKGGE